jgi:hypothetical protein
MSIKKADMSLNEPECYNHLNVDDKKALREWVDKRFEKARSVYRTSSYGLKHEFEEKTGIYVTNGEFKGAMLEAGFVAANKDELNWHFRVKNKKN